jgi:hypothetical protein
LNGTARSDGRSESPGSIYLPFQKPSPNSARTACWHKPLRYARSQNTARPTPPASDDSTGLAVYSTNISRSHDVSPSFGHPQPQVEHSGQRGCACSGPGREVSRCRAGIPTRSASRSVAATRSNMGVAMLAISRMQLLTISVTAATRRGAAAMRFRPPPGRSGQPEPAVPGRERQTQQANGGQAREQGRI